jgi:hypothetical protein
MSSSDALLGQVLRAHDASGELLAAQLRLTASIGMLGLVALGASAN